MLPGAVNHPVFFYLVPTAMLAMIYGVVVGALFAVAALASSAFLLYEPMIVSRYPIMRSANCSGSS